MLRVCNDTSLHIDQLYVMEDLGVANLSPGTCSQYWEMDRVVSSVSLSFTSGGVAHGREPSPERTNLPPGVWSYHVALDDRGQASLRAIEDHPTTFMRVCNDTGNVVNELSWNDAFFEQVLQPGACGPYLPVYVAPVHAPGAFFVAADRYTVAPTNASLLQMAPGRWTFHLELQADRTATLRRDGSPSKSS